ncbi:hypothetical protein NDU88_004515 [Pleurodeles waltl]|uniref:Uncharacterized protein n=1 Tax=Pleurodeles waltl TaxID=8319 RepID=A0AAV7PD18_PLEWA|nr:hypothetical protein NDU88_004515 [Pleurodeles waltl]
MSLLPGRIIANALRARILETGGTGASDALSVRGGSREGRVCSSVADAWRFGGLFYVYVKEGELYLTIL